MTPADITTGLWQARLPLVLASRSTIRSSILQSAGIPHLVHPAEIDERDIERRAREEGAGCGQVALELARAKARAVSHIFPGHYCLGADQVCIAGKEILHKAADEGQLRTKLRKLRNGAHSLVSAICICRDGEEMRAGSDEATLVMRDFTDDFLDVYISCGGPGLYSAVGGYEIEKSGMHLFHEVRGDHYTILGLPLLVLLNELGALGLLKR